MKSCRDRFQGCLIGAVIGDCLGAPFEGQCTAGGIKRERLLKIIHPEEIKVAQKNDKSPLFKFTDDTAMAKSVCSSLIYKSSFNAVDMASRFMKEYIREKNRGYGGAIRSVFDFWHKNIITLDNVFQPSIEQFKGSGSYGNGAAMRVAPVALFAKSSEECVKIAKESALLTHSNRNGYVGAILQALVVYKVVYTENKINSKEFIQELKEEMSKFENNDNKNETTTRTNEDLDEENQLYEHTRSSAFSYTKQLDIIGELLNIHKLNKTEDDVNCVIERLGRDVSAQQAVPTAIYCFLRNLDTGFSETLYYAISIGGDTDTIATMCAAIAGSYYGNAAIPSQWKTNCEGCDEMKDYADKFYEMHYR